MGGFIHHLGPVAQALLAAVFAFSSLSKLARLRDLQRTLAALGLIEVLTRPAAITVVSAELAAALGLATVPQQAWPRLLAAILAVGFAAVGVRALRLHRQIECACFGGARRGTLGWRQVQLLPLFLLALVVAEGNPPNLTLAEGLLGLAVLLLGFSYWLAARGAGLWRRIRDDRVAQDEILNWFSVEERTAVD